jgi:hypothetical protein
MGSQTLFRGIAQALVATLAVKTISCLLLVSVLEGLASTLYLLTEIPRLALCNDLKVVLKVCQAR